MKRFVLCLSLLFSLTILNAQFTPGNIVLLRDSSGVALSNASAAVFLDEYTTAGVLVQSISIPNTTAGNRLTMTGNSTSEGLLTLSQDGRYLLIAGYDQTTGVANVATSAVNRVVGRIDYNENIDLTTKINDGYTTNSIRAAASDDGNNIWTSGNGSGGSGGIHYVTLGNTGASVQISTSSTNTRALNINSGQLYATISNATGNLRGVNTVGNGLPVTTGETISLIPGVADASPNTSPCQFIFFDTNPYIFGPDLLYVADDNNGGTSGLWKLTFDGTTWTVRGHLTGRITGLTGLRDCSDVTTLFVSTAATTSKDTVYKIIDNSAVLSNITGDGTAISAAGAVFVVATANTTAYRGLAIAPANGYTVTGTQSIPTGNYNTITVKSGGVATLTGNIVVYDKVTVENGGTLVMGTNVISTPAGIGSIFDLQFGGILKIGSAYGITASATGATGGNIQTCKRYFSNFASYEYNGTVPQVTGNGLPNSLQTSAGILIINNGAGLGTNGVTLTQTTSIGSGEFVLTNGKLTTSTTSTIYLGSASTTTATYNNTSFVNGPMGKYGNTPYTFPIGKGVDIHPAGLTPTNGDPADFYTIEYFKAKPALVCSGAVNLPINHISKLEYWSIQCIPSASSPLLSNQLTLYATGYSDATDRSSLVVARCSGGSGSWQSQGNDNTVNTGSTGPITSLTAITGASLTTIYTLASIAAYPVNPLPINLISFDATKLSNTKASINWELADYTSAAARFEIQRAGADKNFSAIATINGSETNRIYNYIDNGLKNGINYYRIKMIDETGMSTFSRTVAVMNGVNGLLLTSLIPTVVTNTSVLTVASSGQRKLDIIIVDMQGRAVLNRNYTVAAGNTNIELSLSGLASGVYQLTGTTTEGRTNTLRFIKQ